MFLKTILSIFTFLGQLFLAVRVFAANVGVSYPEDEHTNVIQSGHSYNYTQYVQNMYSFAMKAAVALCTLMLIYAGYKYLTSRGDSGDINEAKDILVSTLMGAALLMLVSFVGYISGINISWTS